MRHAASIADDIKPVILCLQILIELNLHIVKLDLHSVEEGVGVRRSRSDLVEGVDHLDDAVQDPLGQDQ